RRYPFGLAPVGEEGEPVLCVDTVDEVLTDTGGLPLYEGLKPGRLLKTAIDLCQAMEVDAAAAARLIQRLTELSLLDRRAAHADMPDGARLSLSGFLTIDEARFRALDDEAFLEFRRAGWLAPIYAQMNSALNWNRLADQVYARQAA
ncbi:MAG TPA: SapC family protein, partial [Phenylobacterium sp.]|nr:SapC family protein [Phenylobacterium sp.]